MFTIIMGHGNISTISLVYLPNTSIDRCNKNNDGGTQRVLGDNIAIESKSNESIKDHDLASTCAYTKYTSIMVRGRF